MMSFLSNVPFLATAVASRRVAVALALTALALLCAGCASERARVEETEQMLAAAGFHVQPADTSERQAQLAALPPHKLLAQGLQVGGSETTGYVYADPDVCHCIYVGDEKAFQAFQQLAFQKRLADEYLQAARMSDDARFDWNLWGPIFWGPAPVVVVYEHGRR